MKTYLRFPGHSDVFVDDYTPEEALKEYSAIFDMPNFDHMIAGKPFRLDHSFEAPITENDHLIILFKEHNEVFE